MAKSRANGAVRERQAGRLPLITMLGQLDRHASRMLESVLSQHGLTVDQWRALDLLADGKGHPMSELAATLVVPGATLTKIMDKLVDFSYVYRLVDDEDRRRVLAFMSDKGAAVHAELTAAISALEDEFLACLADSDSFVAMVSQLSEDLTGDRRGR